MIKSGYSFYLMFKIGDFLFQCTVISIFSNLKHPDNHLAIKVLIFSKIYFVANVVFYHPIKMISGFHLLHLSTLHAQNRICIACIIR